MLGKLRGDLQKLGDPEKAQFLSKFFKTGKGQYAEGDIFLGITVPAQRIIAGNYKDLSLSEIRKLLRSRVHEERLVGLLILVEQYKKSDIAGKSQIFNFYFENISGVNNWDLVDLSAPNIVGSYLINNKKMQFLL